MFYHVLVCVNIAFKSIFIDPNSSKRNQETVIIVDQTNINIIVGQTNVKIWEGDKLVLLKIRLEHVSV